MKTIEELLKNLARPEVLEFGLVTNRLPSVNVGGRFEPVDDEAPTTQRLLEILSTVGGGRHVETLGDKPVQWTTRVDGVGVIAVAAIMRKDVVQARFTVARRDAGSKPQRAAQPSLTSTQTSMGQTPREPSPAAPPVAPAASQAQAKPGQATQAQPAKPAQATQATPAQAPATQAQAKPAQTQGPTTQAQAAQPAPAAGAQSRQASSFNRTMPGTGPAMSSPAAQAKPAGPQVRPAVQPGPKPSIPPPSAPSIKVSVPPPPTTASAQAPVAVPPPSAANPPTPSQTDPSPTHANPLADAVPPPDDWDDDDEPTVQTLSPPLSRPPGSTSAAEAKPAAEPDQPKPKPARKPDEVPRETAPVATPPRTERGVPPPPPAAVAPAAPPAAREDSTEPQPARAVAASDVEITRNLPNAEKLALDLESLDEDDDDGNTVEIAPSAGKLPVGAAQGPLPVDAVPQTSPSAAVATAATPAAPALPPSAVEPERPRGDATLDAYLGMAVAAHATDVHIVAGRPLLLRVASDLLPRSQSIEPTHVERIVSEIVPAAARARLESEGACDFAFEHGKHGRFRVNVSRQRTGYKLSMRVVPREPPTRAALGLPEAIGQVAAYPSGLVLVTGPTGHGKSSTVAAIIDQVNADSARHVVTVEDPIEHLHPKKRGVVSQREVGAHARSSAVALRAALREDPDVLSVGELRDAETVRLAFDACDAGCVVLATVAASSATRAIERVVDLFPQAEHATARARLAGSLRALFGQRLVPSSDRMQLRAAVEVLPWSVALYGAIRDGRTHQIPALQQRGKVLGIVRLDEALAELVKQQRVTLEVAKQFAEVPQDLDVLSARTSSPGMPAVRKP